MTDDRFFVKTLTLENFRCFEKVELGPFDPHFNLLVGTNGSGKSSVLLALANLFRPIARGPNLGPSILGERDVRVNGPAGAATKSPFAQPDPWELRSDFRWRGAALVAQELSGDLFAPTVARMWRNPDGSSNEPISRLLDDPAGWPGLIALYTTDRRFQNESDKRAGVNGSRDSVLHSGFKNWLCAGASVDALREWMREQTLIALQDRALDKYSAFVVDRGESHASSPHVAHLEILQNAIREAVEGATSVEYVERRKDVVIRFGDGSVQEFSKMSDGQRALIGLIGDIVRRACFVFERRVDSRDFKETPGLVLIDELDLHLHPRWQRRVVGDLKRIFPNIQFFATTHSPQIIGEARPEEIVMLTATGQKRPMGSYGMDSNWVLECVMEVEERDPEIARRIKTLFDAIEDDHIEEARDMIAALRTDMGDAPVLVGAESYIWRIEHEGDEAAE